MSLSLSERFSLDRFFVGEKPASDEVTLSHNRIFILPTKSGLMCGLLLIIMLMASIVYNNNLGFVLTFFLAAISLTSIFHTFLSMTGLSIKVGKSSTVFAGGWVSCAFQITNNSTVPRIHLNLSLRHAKVVSVDLPAYSTATPQINLRTQHRGWLSYGTLTVFNDYPLGLFKAWSPIRFRQKILVYPQPADYRFSMADSQSLPDGTEYSHQGNDDFVGLRPYQSGESLRHIHWKSFAKGQGVNSKQFNSEFSSELWLDIDQTPGNSLEDKISLLCRMVLDAEASGIRYGLKLPGFLKAPDKGNQHHRECLKSLALL